MSLGILQNRIGAEADGIFGPATLAAFMEHFNKTGEEAVHFFAQCAHESAMFRIFNENLNYSAEALVRVFRKYFPDIDAARPYARNPRKIASKVYAKRMGNGDEISQEGWRFRGRGAIQLTGKQNYVAFRKHIGEDVLENPQLVATKYAFESAMFFFDNSNVWELCTDFSDECIEAVTRKINGGTNGLAHRKELTEKYAQYL